ncbi:hypothetical protein [Thalassospira mesophila]|uniref:Uncharacterized protein n=1 Tax=Thalassospira mesophila TaxID=1293891 RepID=A0A1Y2L237_9PROT|nr:hypothetical protein [Thalassospira mesophila]OSQ38997.1 hypothetical protein TMES_09885 [Thalassospira mesophila]
MRKALLYFFLILIISLISILVYTGYQAAGLTSDYRGQLYVFVKSLQWETVLAGALGLLGGVFALIAVNMQREWHTDDNTKIAYIIYNKNYNRMHEDITFILENDDEEELVAAISYSLATELEKTTAEVLSATPIEKKILDITLQLAVSSRSLKLKIKYLNNPREDLGETSFNLSDIIEEIKIINDTLDSVLKQKTYKKLTQKKKN